MTPFNASLRTSLWSRAMPHYYSSSVDGSAGAGHSRMTLNQLLAVLVLLGTVALLLLDRLRYDLAGLLGLLAAVGAGVVPAAAAFRGFSDDIVVIVAAAFVISAAVARSGLAEAALRPLAPRLGSTGRQVVALVSAVTLLSAFIKNIAALAIFLPVAFQLARRHGTPAGALLMPMAFGALLGGMMTLIGTSPNIVVSRMRAEIVGEPFRMFDFLPVGAGLAVTGVAFLALGWRLLPGGRAGTLGGGGPFRVETTSPRCACRRDRRSRAARSATSRPSARATCRSSPSCARASAGMCRPAIGCSTARTSWSWRAIPPPCRR